MLADASKFDRIAGYQVGALGKFDNLVCDTEPEPALMQALQRNAVEVI